MTYGPHGAPYTSPPSGRGRPLVWSGGALLVLAVVGGPLLLLLGIGTASSTLANYQRVSAATGGSVAVSEAGDFRVFHEKPGVSDRMSDLDPSALRLIGPDGRVERLVGSSGSHTYSINEREGREIASFTAADPGTYRLDVVGDRVSGDLAVGQGSVLGSIGFVLFGIFGGMLVGLVGVVLLIVGIVQRVSSRRVRPSPPMPGFAGVASPTHGSSGTASSTCSMPTFRSSSSSRTASSSRCAG